MSEIPAVWMARLEQERRRAEAEAMTDSELAQALLEYHHGRERTIEAARRLSER